MKRSLYREYRPQTFEELVGQDHVARTLRNAVESGSVAHAYVFAGPRGTGKTSTARILAKALDCVGPDGAGDAPTPSPCGVCEHCRSIAAATSLDVIEMDAASHRGIEDVRDLRDTIAFAPVHGRFKVYIIDEVHMLTREAFNALLKTLEEPPGSVVFVLATTEPHKIPETIISRCQRFDFRRPQATDIARLLRRIVDHENDRPDDARGVPRIDIEDAALLEIARHSQGGFRDAIGTLDKLVTYAEGAIRPADVLDALGVTPADQLVEITDIVAERETAEALRFVQRLAEAGTDYSQFIRDLLRHLRQVFLLQHLEATADDEQTLRVLAQTVELDEQLVGRLLPQAHQLHAREVVRFIELLGEAQREIRDGLDPRLQLELALVKVTRPHLDHSSAALEERLRRLEAGGGQAVSGPSRQEPVTTPGSPPQTSPGDAGGGEPAGAEAQVVEAPPAEAPAAEASAAPEKPATPATAAADESPAVGQEVSEAAAGGESPAGGEITADAPSVTLDRVRRAWDLILQHLQGSSPALYALVRDARPAGLSAGRLSVAVHGEVALTRARQGSNPELLAAAVHATLDASVVVEFVPAEAPAAAQQAAPEPAPDTLDFTDLIKQATQAFDAEQLPDET